ncbi:MAG: uroporphyrinogen-III synthase [Planctomycetes bacterium]|nr:uroporphyrinogen-III synthase [Planctomycetota bacterium]MCB9910236.1 uroporphyrinogen-III synthase [Planctomycetota bacterium]HPF12843.1 uroporphyrinogen-III synthase [Planctomycetota bacterium]
MAAQSLTVWLTRSRAGNQAWRPKLEQAGWNVACLDTLDFEPLPIESEALAQGLSAADWVLFASPRGVQVLAQRGWAPEPGQRLGCVGPATAEAIELAWRGPDLVAEGATGEALAQELLAIPLWQSATVVCAQSSTGEPAHTLGEAGKQVLVLPVYRTYARPLPSAMPSWRTGDVVLVASPSAVNSLLNHFGPGAGLRWVSIGPTTSQALRAQGIEPAAQAAARTIDALLAALDLLEARHER